MGIVCSTGTASKIFSIATINSYLLVLLAFFFMTSIAIGNFLLFLILLLWLLEGNFQEKMCRLRGNPFVYAALAFVGLHFVGLLWTSDWEFAAFVIKKEIKYLMIPVLMTVIRREHMHLYIIAFIASMIMMVGISYAVYTGVIPPYSILGVEDPNNPTPFVHHIVYNPVLAFVLYLLLYAAFMMQNLAKGWRALALLLFVIMGINMFVTAGRMGQLVFLVLIALFVFQYYRGKLLQPLLLALALVLIIAPSAYKLSPMVQQRVQLAVYEISNFEQEANSSAGLRVIMLLNSLEIIRDNPIIGVGTGDYRMEYRIVNQQNYPEATRGEVLTHPHNVYVQEMVQFGLLGLAVLGYIFYSMWIMYRRSSSPYRPIMLAFPVFYGVIFLSDGYIMDHYLTFLFLLFGAMLYANPESQHG